MNDWHLLCITRKGRVSILKNLDLRTARETYKRLRPDEHPVDYIFPDCKKCGERGWSWCDWGGSYSSTDDGLDKVEAIGPEGEELKPWEGVKPHVRDMTHLCRCPKPQPPAPLVEATIFETRAMREAGGLEA